MLTEVNFILNGIAGENKITVIKGVFNITVMINNNHGYPQILNMKYANSLSTSYKTNV